MAKYISKIEGTETLANGQKRNVTKLYLVDEDGTILHDKSFEDDAPGVNRRIEVHGFKIALRRGMTLRKKDKFGVMQYEKPFWEEFPGTMDQAEQEMAEELKMKAEIEKEYKDKMKKAEAKKVGETKEATKGK